jgi:hypothetical protein
MADKSSVGFSGNETEVDLESLRTQLRKMNDQELRRFELAAKFELSCFASFADGPSFRLVGPTSLQCTEALLAPQAKNRTITLEECQVSLARRGRRYFCGGRRHFRWDNLYFCGSP